MTFQRWVLVMTTALAALCASCGKERGETTEALAGGGLPVVRIAANEPTLALSDIDLSLELVSRDGRGVPKEIRVAFRNKSAQRGCLALPRPVSEDGTGFDATVPFLLVGMRSGKEDDFTAKEPGFMYAQPRGEPAGPLEGVYLDAGASFARQYDLSSFCLIGHGIGPKAAANFLTCYQAGDLESELRALLMTEGAKVTEVRSNPVLVRTSEVDFSIREKLGEE